MITLKVKSVNKYMVTCSLAKKKSKIINALLYLHNFDLHRNGWHKANLFNGKRACSSLNLMTGSILDLQMFVFSLRLLQILSEFDNTRIFS